MWPSSQKALDVGTKAPWRLRPKSRYELLADIIDRGHRISPIFEVPWVSSKIFRVDWLHAVDLGVAADWLGNVFWMLALEKLPGHNIGERVSALWIEMQQSYRDHNIDDYLGNLAPSMIKAEKNFRSFGLKLLQYVLLSDSACRWRASTFPMMRL